MTTPDDLIQLMRLSGTSKVRVEIEKIHHTSPYFFHLLCELFSRCRRDSAADAWPPAPR